VWRLSCLCGCSGLDVRVVPQAPLSDPTVVSEPRFNKGYYRGSRFICAESSNDGTSSVGPFAEKPAMAMQASKKLSLEGGACVASLLLMRLL